MLTLDLLLLGLFDDIRGLGDRPPSFFGELVGISGLHSLSLLQTKARLTPWALALCIEQSKHPELPSVIVESQPYHLGSVFTPLRIGISVP
jgi:hypothetical protein